MGRLAMIICAVVSLFAIFLAGCTQSHEMNTEACTLTTDNTTASDTAEGTLQCNTESKFEKKEHRADGIDIDYWLYTPKDAEKSMPLIVYLHGGSGRGGDLELITAVDGFPQYLRDGKISPQAYVIIPQIPSSARGWAEMKKDIRLLILEVCREYMIDECRISLTGHSMGGTGAWMLALSYPDVFAAVAPLSGSIALTDSNLEKLKVMSVWAVVGTDDKIVDPKSSTEFISELSKINENARLTVLDGTDHFNVPNKAYLSADIDIITWLITQVK